MLQSFCGYKSNASADVIADAWLQDMVSIPAASPAIESASASTVLADESYVGYRGDVRSKPERNGEWA